MFYFLYSININFDYTIPIVPIHFIHYTNMMLNNDVLSHILDYSGQTIPLSVADCTRANRAKQLEMNMKTNAVLCIQNQFRGRNVVKCQMTSKTKKQIIHSKQTNMNAILYLVVVFIFRELQHYHVSPLLLNTAHVLLLPIIYGSYFEVFKMSKSFRNIQLNHLVVIRRCVQAFASVFFFLIILGFHLRNYYYKYEEMSLFGDVVYVWFMRDTSWRNLIHTGLILALSFRFKKYTIANDAFGELYTKGYSFPIQVHALCTAEKMLKTKH